MGRDEPTTGMAALLALARSRHGAFHPRRCDDFGVNPVTVRNRADLAAVLHVDPLRPIAIEGLRAGALELRLLQERIAIMPPGEPRRRLEQVAADLARVTTDSSFAYGVL